MKTSLLYVILVFFMYLCCYLSCLTASYFSCLNTNICTFFSLHFIFKTGSLHLSTFQVNYGLFLFSNIMRLISISSVYITTGRRSEMK